MNPKFSVGEIVIVQFPHYPESNGEYEVVDIFTWEGFRKYCNNTFTSNNGEPIMYRLKDYVVIGHKNPEHKTDCCSEPHLRKKHQKGDMSFKELVTNLNSKIQEKV